MESPIIIDSVKKPKRRRRQPASAHQIAVNRANAARSTGPNTPEGKASSSQNAIKHGLAASRFSVVRVEDPAQLQELRANLLHCYQPVNTQEIEALDCMARAQLSMRRAAQLEASLFTTSINQAWADPRIRMEPELETNILVSVDQNRGFYLAEGIRLLAKESNGLSLMLRYQAHAERLYRRALEEFERLKKLRTEMPNEPISEAPFPGELKRNEVVTPPDPQPPIPDPQPSGGAGDLCRPSDTVSADDPERSGGAGGLCRRSSNIVGAQFERGERSPSANKRVDDAHAGVREIGAVSRGYRQIMDGCRRGDKAIFDRHRFAGSAKTSQQFRPFQARVCVPRQTVETPRPSVEPVFQGFPLPSFRKNKNPKSQFTEDDRINGDLPLLCPQPLDHSRIRIGFRRLAQNVGIDQIFHSASVDSDSMGTKKSFTGQARSQSMTPSFGGATRRTRR